MGMDCFLTKPTQLATLQPCVSMERETLLVGDVTVTISAADNKLNAVEQATTATPVLSDEAREQVKTLSLLKGLLPTATLILILELNSLIVK